MVTPRASFLSSSLCADALRSKDVSLNTFHYYEPGCLAMPFPPGWCYYPEESVAPGRAVPQEKLPKQERVLLTLGGHDGETISTEIISAPVKNCLDHLLLM